MVFHNDGTDFKWFLTKISKSIALTITPRGHPQILNEKIYNHKNDIEHKLYSSYN